MLYSFKMILSLYVPWNIIIAYLISCCFSWHWNLGKCICSTSQLHTLSFHFILDIATGDRKTFNQKESSLDFIKSIYTQKILNKIPTWFAYKKNLYHVKVQH